jgi:hypothetical protein
VIIMPVPYRSEPEKCPGCGKEENKIEVCAHCGHKYVVEYTYPLWWVALIIDIGIFFGFFYLMNVILNINDGNWWSIPAVMLSLILCVIAGVIPWAAVSVEKGDK